jgi:polyhydroxyalkanoate synthesis regulator protein
LAYVDVAQLRALAHASEDVTVLDAQSGEDITTAFWRLTP